MKTLAFFLDSFEEGSAAQQVLDRLLFGWPEKGSIASAPWDHIRVPQQALNPAMEKRLQASSKLQLSKDAKEATQGIDAWIIAPGRPESWKTHLAEDWYECLSNSPARGWVIGIPPLSWCQGEASISPSFQAGTPMPYTWRLPEVDIPWQCPLSEIMLLVRGAYPEAETHGIDALLGLTSHRQGGESGIQHIRLLRGDAVWKGAREGLFSWDLFKAAVSRTHSKQGDATVDGRTQDIVGLGMVPDLARDTRAWIIQHVDGLQSVLLTVDGILHDETFAAKSKDGRLYSAQIYQPPKPNDHRYSRLTTAITQYLEHDKSTMPPERHLLWGELLECMDAMMSEDILVQEWDRTRMPFGVNRSPWSSEGIASKP